METIITKDITAEDIESAYLRLKRSVYYENNVLLHLKVKLAEFEKANAANLAIDAGGNLAYLAPNRVNLNLTQERWKDIVFHETREHSVNLNE